MYVEAHIIAWNEAETIKFTIKHYEQFCDHIIIYDNFSTDNTREIAEEMGCEVSLFGIKGVLDDREYTKLKNNVCRNSNADWVVIVDADEILYWPADLRYLLEFNTSVGSTIFKTQGWQMVSHEMPKESWFDINTGFQYDNYSKLCIFNPCEIIDINYIHGCHVANPKGNVKFSEQELKLFHFRKVGGPGRLVQRYADYMERMSDWNIRWKAGEHYMREQQRTIKEWQEDYKKSVPYSQAGF